MDNILNTITAYREERKWSLYDLATHAELKTSTISTWYNNNVPVALTPQQMQIIEKWSILRPDQQEAVLNLLNTIP